MSRIFISHSSLNNAEAIRLRDWLAANGWDDVFLDLDPHRGLAPGERWQEALKAAAHRCEAVLALISPEWLASIWCRAEMQTAKLLGKRIFPVLIAEVDMAALPLEIKVAHQVVDLVRDPHASERLKEGLRRAGLDPASFPFPEGRRPYPGLEPLTEDDPAIFFGREAQVVRGLDRLRALRDAGVERLLVILGASGAGKSSYLRAGLIPRLRRDDRNFVLLPVVRPERAALTGKFGLAAALAAALSVPHVREKLAGTNLPRSVAAVRDYLRDSPDGLAHLLHVLRQAWFPVAIGDEAPAPPAIVLAIDQGEEIFNEDGRAEAEMLLDLLSRTFEHDRKLLAILAMRADAYPRLQQEPRLAQLAQEPFSLPPMPEGSFRLVIEGPAPLATPPLKFEPALVEALLHDATGPDALPLLAFTLQRLYNDYGAESTIGLAHYERLGGISGAIAAVITEAKAKARARRDLPTDEASLEALLRQVFIPHLVRVTAEDEFARRVARLDEIPAVARPLVDLLVDQRLLVKDRRPAVDGGGEVEVVEVAHEALLREWSSLARWLGEEKSTLRVVDAVARAARDWDEHQRQGEWLMHKGGRLQYAETLARRPDMQMRLGVLGRSFLSACRNAEDAERRAEEERRVQEREYRERTRRFRRRWALGLAAATLLLVLWDASDLRRLHLTYGRDAAAFTSLAAAAIEQGYYDRAARYALAGLPSEDASSLARWLAPRSYNLEAMLGDAARRTRLHGVLGHEDSVWSAAFSSDGSRIVTASRDKTARVWDVNARKEIAVLKGHEKQVRHAAFARDGTRIVTTSYDKTARIWDAGTQAEIVVLKGHEKDVRHAAFSPDGALVVTASADKTARIWDAQAGQAIVMLEGHEGSVNSAAFSSDGARVVTASADKTARIWDVRTGTQIAVLKGHQDTVMSAAFSLDRTRVATASEDKTARLWDASTGAEIAIFKGHELKVWSAAFSPDGTHVVTASDDKTARIWDAQTASVVNVFKGHSGSLISGIFSPDGAWVVTASQDKTARVWDVRGRSPDVILKGHAGPVRRVALSPDGTRVVTASNDGTVRIWDAKTGAKIQVLEGHEGAVRGVGFSPDGSHVVTASSDKTARIWDTRTGTETAVLRGHEHEVLAAAFSPDGVQIVTASKDKTARLWDARNGEEITVLSGHHDGLLDAAFSPDGALILTASADGTARIWNSNTRAVMTVLVGHHRVVWTASFSPDGMQIVTASRDKTARIWDARNGKEIAILRGHGAEVNSAAFSPDGTRVVTASDDFTASIWDVKTRTEVAVLWGHEDEVWDAAFGPDGTWVVTASRDKTARIWDVAPVGVGRGEALRKHVCGEVLANAAAQSFSDEEMHEPVLRGRDRFRNPCGPRGPF